MAIPYDQTDEDWLRQGRTYHDNQWWYPYPTDTYGVKEVPYSVGASEDAPMRPIPRPQAARKSMTLEEWYRMVGSRALPAERRGPTIVQAPINMRTRPGYGGASARRLLPLPRLTRDGPR